LIENRNAGLRERKKQRMRELIAETALRLFLDRGFARVTVAEVARAADVAEQTVYNYFPAKEHLIYWRLEGFGDAMLAAVRERPAGASVLDAFLAFILGRGGLLGSDDPAALERLVAINRLIAESPALLDHERRVFDRYTDALASLLAAEADAASGREEAWVVANALVGVQRVLVGYVRSGLLAGEPAPRLRRRVRDLADRAFGRLDAGLRGYGVR
jgi:AcrR family transcriptional regulator